MTALRRVLRHIAKHAPSTVLWCGDQVDTGDDAEWKAWTEVVDSVPGLSNRVLPGNHDICFNRPFDHDFALTRRAARERAFADHAVAGFPLFDTIVSERGPITTVMLDSCRHPSTHVLSNAVGEFGKVALCVLERALARVRGPLLVATHHHVWRDEHFLRPESWFETAIDAHELVTILSSYRRRAAQNHVLVVHGHRHILGAGSAGEPGHEIQIVALPSTTLGDKPQGVLDTTLRYAIAGLRADGTWGVAIREVGAH
jgi:hypothetical protein